MDDKPRLRPVEVFPVEEGRGAMVCIRDATGLSDRVVTASVAVVPVLRMLDGTHNLLDIQAALTRERGEIVFSDDIRQMLDVLDEALLLEGDRFEGHCRRLREDFADAPVRRATSAGGSYPAEAEALRVFLDEILASAELPASTSRDLRGLIAPHIDHPRGRRSYADAYAALAHAEPADLFVLLGTSHAPTTERFALTRKDFETPLGVARTDVDVVDALLERSSCDLLADEFVHRAEHSIELELVFIQHLCEQAGRAFKIVPILCGSFPDASPDALPGVVEVIDALRDLMNDAGRRVVIVAGADLAHVGPRFGGEQRVTPRMLADLERVDRETLAFVEGGDADGFFAFVMRDENARNICSVASVYLSVKALEPCAPTLLRYEQWSDDDGASCVTFAAMAIQ